MKEILAITRHWIRYCPRCKELWVSDHFHQGYPFYCPSDGTELIPIDKEMKTFLEKLTSKN